MGQHKWCMLERLKIGEEKKSVAPLKLASGFDEVADALRRGGDKKYPEGPVRMSKIKGIRQDEQRWRSATTERRQRAATVA